MEGFTNKVSLYKVTLDMSDIRQIYPQGPATPSTRKRAPEQKRKALLAAARELFVTRGFHGATTMGIARHAGVSEGVLFHQFGSKAGLYGHLAEEYGQAAVQAVMPPDQPMTADGIVRRAFDFAAQDPALYRLMNHDGPGRGDAARPRHAEIIIDAIHLGIIAGMDRRDVRLGPSRIMAELQFAIVLSAFEAWQNNGDPAMREDYINEAITSMKLMLGASDSINGT